MANIVFDLDGTLVDSAASIGIGVNAALADLGAAPLTPEELRRFIGNGGKTLMTRALTARGIGLEGLDAAHEAFLGYYKPVSTEAPIFDGVRETLQALVDEGHSLGICTNKIEGPARDLIETLGLTHFFKVIIGGDTLPVVKPDPAPLRAAFEALGGMGLYFGDSEVDAETAHAVGVPFFLYTKGYLRGAVEATNATLAFDDWSVVYPALKAKGLI